MDYFHPVEYAANSTDLDTPSIHKAIHVPYREVFIYAMYDDIDALHKKPIFSIVS